MASTGTVDTVWRATDTTPSEIDAALRRSLAEVHRQNDDYAPGRVLNLVCVVDDAYSGEIANRLRGVGRYHPSRTIICAVEPRRAKLDAVATISAPAEVGRGELGLLRETVVVKVGERHLRHLDRIVDPLVVTDLLTCTWSPHGHAEAVDSLMPLSQAVLLDSVDEPDPGDALHRACELARSAHVVDLAWLRSTPWRERIAATFDPLPLRGELQRLSAITVRHHPDSGVVGAMLLGWLASRLGWRTAPMMYRSGVWEGRVSSRRLDVRVRLEADRALAVRGLSGITIETASGRHFSLERGAGGLRAHYRHDRGTERRWTVLGASRGEPGILAEGIRQALLRDPTYAPALTAAQRLLG